MAKQTFTTGQVLLASQLTSLQQTAMLGGAASAKTSSYTLVSADAGTAISMTSTSATTITVNTGLFAAGDTVHITNLGAGVCTITAGTATVNSSASLALAQYESGFLDFTSASAAIFIKGAGATASSGGMTVIGETAASALSSLTFSGFGSYKQLLLMWAGIKHSGSGSVFGLRFNNNSSADTYAGNGILNFSTDDRFRANSLINGTGSGDVAPFGTNASAAGKETQCYGYVLIDNVSSSTKSKSFEFSYGFFNSASATTKGFTGQGAFFSTTAITTVDIVRLSGSDTFTNQNDTTIRLLGIS